MISFRSSLFAAACASLLLSGCGSSSYGVDSGAAPPAGGGTSGATPPGNPIGSSSGTTGTSNSVVATLSTSGTVSVVAGGTRNVAIVFTSSDGRAISGFGISGSLGNLPAGWKGPNSFACSKVSTGSGCVLNLSYAPMAAANGSITLNYVFVDNSAMPQTTSSLTFAYVATPQNNVVATAAPSGQVNALINGAGQPVTGTFTTDDGRPATSLAVTTNLGTLPAGWTASSSTLSCASLSTGNGCQLSLMFAPATAGNGTLSLGYSYIDDGGAAKTGTLNIPYAGTTNDNVVATASPSGQINAVVGAGNQPVTVTFTTDDGRPASALTVTTDITHLPSGWSSTLASFSCSTLSTGSGCRLPLTYAPSGAGGGTLSLAYAYIDDSGNAKTGSIGVSYQATTSNHVIGTSSPTAVSVITGNSMPVAITFTTDDGNPATAFAVTTDLTALPSGWSSVASSLSCAAVSSGNGCQLALSYAPGAAANGSLSIAYSYTDNSGTPKTGTASLQYAALNPPHLYVPQLTGGLQLCPFNSDGSLGACASTGSGFSSPTSIAFYGGNLAYVSDYYSNSLYVCAVAADGSLSGCASTGSNFQYPLEIAISGTTLYVTNADSTGGVTTCAIGGNGSLSSCLETSGTGSAGIAANATSAYIGVGSSTVDVCAIGSMGALSSCAVTGSGFSGAVGITLSGGYAYVANQSGGNVSACAIDPTTGDLTGCTSFSGGASMPMSVALDGSQAYVDDLYGAIYLCTIALDGTFSACADVTDGNIFSYGINIAVH
ncbi:MAG TPA: hypothetical protein VHV81_09805 [Steroidobacteraceae bacterium]|nr:hypothetical protein [Steroidobacteraceae bacterium]